MPAINNIHFNSLLIIVRESIIILILTDSQKPSDPNEAMKQLDGMFGYLVENESHVLRLFGTNSACSSLGIPWNDGRSFFIFATYRPPHEISVHWS